MGQPPGSHVAPYQFNEQEETGKMQTLFGELVSRPEDGLLWKSQEKAGTWGAGGGWCHCRHSSGDPSDGPRCHRSRFILSGLLHSSLRTRPWALGLHEVSWKARLVHGRPAQREVPAQTGTPRRRACPLGPERTRPRRLSTTLGPLHVRARSGCICS